MFLIKIITSTGIHILRYSTLRAAYSVFMQTIVAHARVSSDSTILLKRASDRIVLHSNIPYLIGAYDENDICEAHSDYPDDTRAMPEFNTHRTLLRRHPDSQRVWRRNFATTHIVEIEHSFEDRLIS